MENGSKLSAGEPIEKVLKAKKQISSLTILIKINKNNLVKISNKILII